MARFSLHAVGQDRPGIVAAVAQALADLGCNLEDSRMTLLHGQFAIVLVLESPGVSSGVAIEEALAPAIEELGLTLLVHPIPDEAAAPSDEGLIGVAIHGADHPGTVARVAGAVAAAGGNIVDLIGHVDPDGGPQASLLHLVVALEAGGSAAALRDQLVGLSDEFGMRCEITEGVARPS